MHKKNKIKEELKESRVFNVKYEAKKKSLTKEMEDVKAEMYEMKRIEAKQKAHFDKTRSRHAKREGKGKEIIVLKLCIEI